MLSTTRLVVLVLLAIALVVEARRYEQWRGPREQYDDHKHRHQHKYKSSHHRSSFSPSSRGRTTHNDPDNDYEYDYYDYEDSAEDEPSSLDRRRPNPHTGAPKRNYMSNHHRQNLSPSRINYNLSRGSRTSHSRLDDRIHRRHKTSSAAGPPLHHTRHKKGKRRESIHPTRQSLRDYEFYRLAKPSTGYFKRRKSHSNERVYSRSQRPVKPKKDWEYNLDEVESEEEEEEEKDDYSGYESDYDDNEDREEKEVDEEEEEQVEEDEEQDYESDRAFEKHISAEYNLKEAERLRKKSEWEKLLHYRGHHKLNSQPAGGFDDFRDKPENDRDFNAIRYEKPPMRSFDEIEARLEKNETTSTTTTTLKPTTQKKRNTINESFMKRDHPKVQWTTSTTTISPEKDKVDIQADANTVSLFLFTTIISEKLFQK